MTSKQWWPAAVLSLAIAPQAWAQWEGSLGAGVLYAPDYLGSDDYETQLWPSLNLNYGDTLSISPRGGIEWHAIRSGDWTISPFIGYTFGRDNQGDIAASEEVDGGATLGLRVALEQGQWQYSLAGSAPVSGDVEGAEFEASAAWRLPLSERAFFTFSPSVTYADEEWTASMFSVSTSDSLRSGIAPYNPDGGSWRLGVSSSLTYALTPQWSATGFVGTGYLTDNASDSPIVDDLGSEWQTVTGVSLNYNF
jgi:outer membrane protein